LLEKGTGCKREVGVEGAGSGIRKLAESGKYRGNYTKLRNISQSKKRKEAGASKNGVETGI